MSLLFNLLMSLFILGYFAFCVFSALIYLRTEPGKEPVKKMKAYFVYKHGQYTLYVAVAVFISGLVIVALSWLNYNINIAGLNGFIR